MIRFVLLFALLAAPAQARSLFDPVEIVDPAVAHAGLERVLESPLPEGTEVLYFVQGGFQDKYWRFSLAVPEEHSERLLALFRIVEGTPVAQDISFLDRDSWAPSALIDPQLSGLRVGTFPEAMAFWGRHPDHPGRVVLFVFAYQL